MNIPYQGKRNSRFGNYKKELLLRIISRRKSKINNNNNNNKSYLLKLKIKTEELNKYSCIKLFVTSEDTWITKSSHFLSLRFENEKNKIFLNGYILIYIYGVCMCEV